MPSPNAWASRCVGQGGAAVGQGHRRARRRDGHVAAHACRSDKLRPGDIVGALTGEAGLHKDAIGRIDVFATRSYVAIARAQAAKALSRLRDGRIKGRRFRINRLGATARRRHAIAGTNPRGHT